MRGDKNIFQDKRILITGGTGSLGQALTKGILSGRYGKPKKVMVFSRDEAKQHDMRLAFRNLTAATEEIIYRDSTEILDFQIGDVRDFQSIASAVRRADIVFNAAALKQVPICEYFPYEAVSTNILGAENIVRSIECMNTPVETVIGISTDKACKPVNVMGMTKAIQERVFVNANLRCERTRFICVRYGNVLASRGSVIPLFHSQIRDGRPVTITLPNMTRFLLSLEQAVETVVAAYCQGKPGEIFVPRIPAARIEDIAKALIGDRDIGITEIGIRPGEKIHEIMVAEDEVFRTVERGDYYVIRPILPELDREKTEEQPIYGEYASNSDVMDFDATLKMLQKNNLTLD